MWNNYKSATNLIDTAVKEIGTRLPARWLLRDRARAAAVRSSRDASRRADAIWELRDPDGLSSDILVEVKVTPVEPRLVGHVADRLQALSASICEQTGATPAHLLVSTYLSPLTRERLTAAGISYADSTGNIRFVVDRPAVYIEIQGTDRNPFREDRPLRSLKGGRAARVARGLLDYRPPFGTRELAGKTGSSAAMVSRVSSLLEPDEIVTKESPRGRIVQVDWEDLARRWAMDYDFASSNALTTWLEPRGTRALFSRLRDTGSRYAVTGSFAGHRCGAHCGAAPGSPLRRRPRHRRPVVGATPGGDRRQCPPRTPIRPRGVRTGRARRRHHLRPRYPGPAGPHDRAGARTGGGGGPAGVDAGP